VISNSSVEEVVRQNFIQHGRRALPICRDGVLEGIVTLADVKKIPQDRWQTTSIQAVMTKPPLHTVQKGDDLNTALKMLAEEDLNQVPVLEDGNLVGLLSRANILNYLQTSQELHIKPKKKEPENKF
jgi:CBS domain-containing protein